METTFRAIHNTENTLKDNFKLTIIDSIPGISPCNYQPIDNSEARLSKGELFNDKDELIQKYEGYTKDDKANGFGRVILYENGK